MATTKLPTVVTPVLATIVINPVEVPKLITVNSNVLMTFALVNTASIKVPVGSV